MTTNHFRIEIPIEIITQEEVNVLRDEFEVEVLTSQTNHIVTGKIGDILPEAARSILLQRVNNQTPEIFT